MLVKVKETRTATPSIHIKDYLIASEQVAPNIIEDKYIDDSGALVDLTDVFISTKINVFEGLVLKILEKSHLGILGGCYNSSNAWVQSIGSIVTLDEIIIPAGIAYIRLNVEQRNNTPICRLVRVMPESQTSMYLDKVTIIGDSIVQGNGATPVTTYLENSLGCDCQNLGIAGNKMADIAGRLHTILPQQDLIMVWAGVNDYIGVTPIGTILDGTTATFYGAINVICNYLKDNFSLSRKKFIIPLPTNSSPNSGVDVLESYAEAIRLCCKRNGIGYIDLFYDAPIDLRYESHRRMYGSDGIHPNTQGQAVIAERIMLEIT